MDGSLINYVTIVFLGVFLVFTEIRNYLERKNLTDRLMARDFQDLVSGEHERKSEKQKQDKNDHIQAI